MRLEKTSMGLFKAIGMVAGLFAVCAMVGCGGEGSPASLTGQVTFEGKPVEDGNIRLTPIEGSPGPGGSAKIVGGKYEIADGPLAGKHQVLITATRAGKMVKDPETGGTVQQRTQYIPEKYNSNTELTIDLQAGENTKDFAL